MLAQVTTLESPSEDPFVNLIALQTKLSEFFDADPTLAAQTVIQNLDETQTSNLLGSILEAEKELGGFKPTQEEGI